MSRPAFYNEIDPFAAVWLRRLIEEGYIAPGVVDERSIEELEWSDIEGFTQVHFFAGIGVWSYALRLAGWPDDRPVWTGSCPCQPFSDAGKRKGTDDKRHLWPEFKRLISIGRPPVVFGEQVASKAGFAWLDAVSTDLEAAGYSVGAADLCAAGVGAPHIRQRLYFVAVANDAGTRLEERQEQSAREEFPARKRGGDANGLGGLGQSDDERRERLGLHVRWRGPLEDLPETAGDGEGEPGPVNGFWSAADWVLCRDPGGPRWRPVEPGTFPLAHGAPARVGRLRGYGNAIVAPLAAEFVKAAMEAMHPKDPASRQN